MWETRRCNNFSLNGQLFNDKKCIQVSWTHCSPQTPLPLPPPHVHVERDDLIGFEWAAICVKTTRQSCWEWFALAKQLQHPRKNITALFICWWCSICLSYIMYKRLVCLHTLCVFAMGLSGEEMWSTDLEDGGAVCQRRGRSRWRRCAHWLRLVRSGRSADCSAYRSGIQRRHFISLIIHFYHINNKSVTKVIYFILANKNKLYTVIDFKVWPLSSTRHTVLPFANTARLIKTLRIKK